MSRPLVASPIMAKDPDEERAVGGTVVPGPELANGSRLGVYRDLDDNVRLGEIRSVKQGTPLSECLILQRREGSPLLDVVGEVRPPSGEPGRRSKSGPAMVASPEFLSRWDKTFEKKPPGELN